MERPETAAFVKRAEKEEHLFSLRSNHNIQQEAAGGAASCCLGEDGGRFPIEDGAGLLLTGAKGSRGALFLFADGEAEVAELAAQGVVVSVHVDEHPGFLHVEGAGDGVDVPLVGTDVQHLGDEHVV